MTLAAEEFLRRFLLHVLPNGFQRIRHYGLFSNRNRVAALALCRLLLAGVLSALLPSPSQLQTIAAIIETAKRCPVCKAASMCRTQLLPPQPWQKASFDTS